MTRPRPPARLLAAALATFCALALLGGCGGDDDAPPPITAQAAADTAIATWNATTAIDVLANDSVSRGDKRLAGVARQPANGTASVADGRISYRPRDGFYGTDTLRYSMASADGAAGAEAEVTITVEAELLLNGQAIDAPLAQAAVQISGAASAAAVTDAQGLWQARVRLSDTNGVLRIDARGTGAQQHVRLTSLAATIALVSAAAANGTVAADKADALTVSHFSTAQAALIARTPAGLPTTATALATAQAAVSPTALLDLATLVHMAADEGLALPEGKADTWALAQDANAVTVLLAAQATADGAAFAAAHARSLGAAPAAGLLPTSGVLVAYPSGAFGETVMVTLAADGAARVSERRGARTARWLQDADGLTLTLDVPFSETSFESTVEPVSNLQVELRRDVTALRLKRLAGGLVDLRTAESETRIDGARAGEVRSLRALGDPGTAQRLAVNPAEAAPLGADDFAVGKRWGGLRQTTSNGQPLGLAFTPPYVDILDVTAAGAGRALRTGTTYNLQVQGAALTVTGSDGSRLQYLRLGEAAPGAWHFAVTDLDNPDAGVANSVLVPIDGSLAWTADTVSRSWRLDGTQTTTALPIALRADGSGSYIGESATWQVLADGRLRIIRPRAEGRQTRADWIPLSRGSDGAVWVLRALFQEPAGTTRADNSTPVWLILRYLDTGPAN
jgi:hypothetical protein